MDIWCRFFIRGVSLQITTKSSTSICGSYYSPTPSARSALREGGVTLSRLCEHRCVSHRISLFDEVETFPAGKRRNIPIFACRRSPAHGLSFFFLQNAKHSCVSSSFFCERRKKNAELNIKNNLKRKHSDTDIDPDATHRPAGSTSPAAVILSAGRSP